MNWIDQWRISRKRDFGQRKLITDIDSVESAEDMVEVECECGNIKKLQAYSLYKSTSKTCGNCLIYKATQNRSQRWNSLTLIDPVTLNYNVFTKVRASCDCGNVIETSVRQILVNKRKDCGSCEVFRINSQGKTKYSKYTIIDDLNSIKHFSQKVNVRCDCGNLRLVFFQNLVTGNSKSCGKCDVAEFRLSGVTKYGSLSILDDLSQISSLSQKVKVKCSCGRLTEKKLFNIYSGHTRTCGNCYESLREWWNAAVIPAKDQEYPISDGPIHQKYDIKNVIKSGRTRIEGTCSLCGNQWNPLYKDVLRGVTLSCGCATYHTSSQSEEIADFIKDYEVTKEYKIGNYYYDIAVLERNLLVEFHGLKWHSQEKRKTVDSKKYKLAQRHGFVCLVIFEDEWRDKKNAVKNIILNRLGSRVGVRIRPSKCDFREIPSKDADLFHEKYHYIGGTKSSMNMAAFHNDECIAVMSFKAPNRQSDYQYELTRFTTKHGFICNGMASKLFKEFRRKHYPTSIVSFSDNRLFSGEMYSKIGFKKDGDVRPDYYWVKDKKRYNKSGLRKKKDEHGTESQLREAQGYSKIYDCGKIRWVWEKE